MKRTLKQVKELFVADTIARKGNKSANAPIIKLIELVANDNATIECETNIKGTCLNRGATVECLIKLLLNKTDNASKVNDNSVADMIIKGVNYEIKYSSSKGYAHYNPRQDLSHLIFVDNTGVYLTSGKNILLDKCGKHIQTIVMNNNVKVLYTF